jgi:NAD(P)-dependent dehydrogenase (short-subunit alcohol dehydrogenase family)
MDEFRLEGKVALVTGAGRGLGRGIATRLARAGADVAVTARTVKSLEDVRREIEALGRRCLPIEADVRDIGEIRAMVGRVAQGLGRLDVLVNNAGINIRTPAFEVTDEEWDNVLDTNLKGLFFCSQAAARVMVLTGGGAIVNLASTMSFVALPKRATYCASKGGVALLTKQLALEWVQHHIRVNAVAPTFVETDMTREVLKHPEEGAQVLSRIPIGRAVEVQEVAATVLFLVSAASSAITGVILPVDGGYLAQ